MKKISAISILVSVAIFGGLFGCASNSDKDSSQSTAQTQPPPKPKKDKRPIEERLTVGMSMDEVKTACGNPKNVSMSSDGTQIWNYNNQQTLLFPITHCPEAKFIT